MATIPRDWKEFIGLLNEHRVRFLVVGAHALAANGRPRATQDLDVFIERTPTNVTRLGRALLAFGFAELAHEVDRFCQPQRMATLGAPPLRIDIMNHIDGVTFSAAWSGRLRAEWGGHLVNFLGMRELKRNKLAAHRAKDLADVALIEEMQATKSRPARARKKASPKPPRRRA
jgi:hypothetical protein